MFCSAKQTDAKHADAKQRAVLCLAISVWSPPMVFATELLRVCALQDDKREKQSFSASFNAAVAFAHTHLSAKRRVLILSAPGANRSWLLHLCWSLIDFGCAARVCADCSVALAVTMAVLVALFDEKCELVHRD